MILRTRILVLTLAFLFGTAMVQAQHVKVKNLDKYDKQRLHFGFLLGTNTTDFKLTLADSFYKQDSAIVVEADKQPGFNLGIIADLKISENFNLRFVPDLAFSQRNINYKMVYPNKSTGSVVKKVESTFLEFPIDLKFKSNRINNYRIYVTGGFKYMIDLVSQAKVNNDEQLVKLIKRDYGYSIGFGVDIYMPLFKFAPEIKMFQGLNNVLKDDPAVYSTSMKSLKSRIFTFSLTFE